MSSGLMTAMHAADGVCYGIDEAVFTVGIEPGELSIGIDFEEPKSICIAQEIQSSKGISGGFHESLYGGSFSSGE